MKLAFWWVFSDMDGAPKLSSAQHHCAGSPQPLAPAGI